MSQCLLNPLGGGLSKRILEQITAGAGDILDGKVIVDKNGNPLTGTMPNKGSWDCDVGIGATVTIPKGYHDGTGTAKNTTTNRGAWNGSVGVNGSVTIPQGYHNGSGRVTNSTPTMGAQTITPSGSQQTVSCSGKYMTGNVIVQAANIFRVQSGSTKASSDNRTFNNGANRSMRYWSVTPSGFRVIRGVAWISSIGGHATSGSSFNIGSSDGSYGGYFTSGGVMTTSQVLFPAGRISGEDVWYWIYGY